MPRSRFTDSERLAIVTEAVEAITLDRLPPSEAIRRIARFTGATLRPSAGSHRSWGGISTTPPGSPQASERQRLYDWPRGPRPPRRSRTRRSWQRPHARSPLPTLTRRRAPTMRSANVARAGMQSSPLCHARRRSPVLVNFANQSPPVDGSCQHRRSRQRPLLTPGKTRAESLLPRHPRHSRSQDRRGRRSTRCALPHPRGVTGHQPTYRRERWVRR
jgi:hypothetical protein